MPEPAWWKEAVFYQIYPRSFQDSNGDGTGDLKGIISRLDYFKGNPDSLGIDALWISPVFRSPMKDCGYDISDYCDIDPVFGTLDDVRELVAKAHALGIRVIFDLVINHTSDRHPWFIEASADRNSPKHDWYIWQPRTRDGKRLRRPNNWVCQFEFTSAWHDNEATDEWYLGTFTKSQPEVNWRNAALREQMFAVIRFWLDMGIDGFRMDVVNWYIKDEKLRDNPYSLNANPDIFQKHIYDRNQEETHEICRQIRKTADSYDGDRVLVGEVFVSDPRIAPPYPGSGSDELHMPIIMELLYRKWNARAFYSALDSWYSALAEGAWPNITLSNHDQKRHARRFFSRDRRVHGARCRAAAALLLTARGTPFLYYGEEIGMTGAVIPKKEMVDPTGITFWPLPLGRDGERTPMQWDSSANAGFTVQGTRPWLRIQDDYRTVNVALQREDPGSLWQWYRRLLEIRRGSGVLKTGGFAFLSDGSDGVLSYVRSARVDGYAPYGNTYRPVPGDVCVYLNFTGRRRACRLPFEGTVLLGNCRPEGKKTAGSVFELAPGEVLLIT